MRLRVLEFIYNKYTSVLTHIPISVAILYFVFRARCFRPPPLNTCSIPIRLTMIFCACGLVARFSTHIHTHTLTPSPFSGHGALSRPISSRASVYTQHDGRTSGQKNSLLLRQSLGDFSQCYSQHISLK